MPVLTYPIAPPIEGLRLDLPPDELTANACIGAANMVFRRGRFKGRKGVSKFGSNTAGNSVRGFWYGGPTIGSGGIGTGPIAGDLLLAATDSAWQHYTAGTWAALSGFSPSACDHTIFRLFPSAANLIIGTNYVDTPHTWDGASGTAAALGGNPAVAKTMMVLANRLILFNLKTASGYTGPLGGTAFDVSNPNDPTTGWSNVLNGYIRDTPGDIVAALESTDLQGYVYKTDGIALIAASGAIDPYTIQLAAAPIIGPVNPRALCALEDGRHVYLGSDGCLYVWDGSTRPYALHASAQKHILATMDPDLTQLKKALVFYDPTTKELTCLYKGNGTNVVSGVLVALTNGSLWPLSFNIGSSDITAAGTIVIPGAAKRQTVYFYGSSGQGYRHNDGDGTDDGNSIPFTWQTPLTDFGLTDKWKTIGHLEHSIWNGSDDPTDAAGASLTGDVDILEQSHGNVAVGDLATFTAGPTDAGDVVYSTDHRTSGRKLGLQYTILTSGGFQYLGGTVRMAIGGAR